MPRNNNKDFSIALEERTKKFAIDVIKFGRKLESSVELDSMKSQLYRSSSSIGANYRGANRAKSKADFRNKIRICEAETSETVYWIEIIGEVKQRKNAEFKKLLKESHELLALFTSISSKLRVTEKKST